jgi:hypothetical protein
MFLFKCGFRHLKETTLNPTKASHLLLHQVDWMPSEADFDTLVSMNELDSTLHMCAGDVQLLDSLIFRIAQVSVVKSNI